MAPPSWRPVPAAESRRLHRQLRESQITRDELTGLTVGGAGLEQLSRELESAGGAAAEAAHVLEEEVSKLGISQSPAVS